MPYNAGASRGSNLGPSNPALADAVKARIEALRAADPGNTAPVPVDLVTASASGLDPHISRAAADYQVARVARVRGLPEARCTRWSTQHTEGRLARLHRRAARQRAAAEPRARRARAEPPMADLWGVLGALLALIVRAAGAGLVAARPPRPTPRAARTTPRRRAWEDAAA